MSITIEQSRYETYAALIESDQIPADEVVAIMRDNSDFARWYGLRSDTKTPNYRTWETLRDINALVSDR